MSDRAQAYRFTLIWKALVSKVEEGRPRRPLSERPTRRSGRHRLRNDSVRDGVGARDGTASSTAALQTRAAVLPTWKRREIFDTEKQTAASGVLASRSTSSGDFSRHAWRSVLGKRFPSS